MVKNNRKKIASTETTIEYTKDIDGNIVDEQTKCTTKLSTSETEPRYVKLYLDDISKIEGLSNNQNNILLSILKLTEFKTNEVILNKWNREKIARSLDTTDQVIRNAISHLVKKQLLLKLATGVYRLNPYVFGAGAWTDIKGLRMIVEYTEQGRNISVEEMPKNNSNNIISLEEKLAK